MKWPEQFEIITDKISSEIGKKASISAISTFLGVSRGKVQAWTRGQRPSADDLETIAHKLNISPVWLLTGEGEMFRTKTKRPMPQPSSHELVHIADTLHDLIPGDLRISHKDFAEAGGVSIDDLEAMIERKIDIPASAIRRWVLRYRVNANFLIAQIGYPLLTRNEYEGHGPLSWVRERNDECYYPEDMDEPNNPEPLIPLDPITRMVADFERAHRKLDPDATESEIMEAVLRALDNRLQKIAPKYGGRLSAREPGSLHETPADYPDGAEPGSLHETPADYPDGAEPGSLHETPADYPDGAEPGNPRRDPAAAEDDDSLEKMDSASHQPQLLTTGSGRKLRIRNKDSND